MDIRDVIVVADSTAATGHRLDLASRLASKFGWRLTGVAMDQTGMLADPTTPDPFNLPPVSSGLLEFFAGEGKEMLEEDVPPSAPHKEPFNVMVDGRPVAWRSFPPDDVSGVARLARIADLIILGQDDSASAKEPDTIEPEGIILSCGGPCLVIPFAGTFNSIGEHVLLAWDGSREAARALRDAKGFLRKRWSRLIRQAAYQITRLPGLMSWKAGKGCRYSPQQRERSIRRSSCYRLFSPFPGDGDVPRRSHSRSITANDRAGIHVSLTSC